MKFAGTYKFKFLLPEGGQQAVVNVRANDRAYEGEVICGRNFQILENVVVRKDTISFDATIGQDVHTFSITLKDGTAVDGKDIILSTGKAQALTDLVFEKKKFRALILYCTMTKNTEKIARAMKESFEEYKWDVTFYRMTMRPKDWEGMQDKLYFDDYDVVALGSPIVAGYPLTVVNKVFSAGAGGDLERVVTKQVEAGGGFQANKDTIKPPPGEGGPGQGGPGGPPPKPVIGVDWRRKHCAYPGGPSQFNYRPLGIVFTTYGGGFYGSGECKATLAALKLFLELQNVQVIGQFACVGKEFGPAGLEEGEKPMLIDGGEMPDPAVYEKADGTKITASYFFHGEPWNHPNDKDVMKAKILISDLVEDMFQTYDGRRAQVNSEYISIS